MNRLRTAGDRPPISKGDYRARALELRQALLQVQGGLREAQVSTILVIAGVDGAGKGETANLLNAWMDPRWITTRAFDGPSDEELERPQFWRYWRALPPYGQLAVFLSAWYSGPLQHRAEGGSREALDTELEGVRRFERMLGLGGTAILKIWLHLDRDAQERRFRALGADPLQSWRVTETDWSNWRHYDQFASATEEILDATDTREAPWIVIDGSDERRRALEIGDALLRLLRARLAVGVPGTTIASGQHPAPEPEPVVSASEREPPNLVKHAYRKELATARARLGLLHRRARDAGISLVGVFEGRDAAGKGGAIRRVVSALDARRVDIVRVAAPSDEERAHHYMWRFWRRIPRAGYVTLFDRSWYGRVLVERVESLATEEEWRRAYSEIRDFEQQLVDHRIVVVKVWFDVSFDEQERRFEERHRVPHKRWKLTNEDIRNRRLWSRYDDAIADMLRETDSVAAPWHVVPADDKRAARVDVLRHICERLEARLDAELSTPEANLG